MRSGGRHEHHSEVRVSGFFVGVRVKCCKSSGFYVLRVFWG